MTSSTPSSHSTDLLVAEHEVICCVLTAVDNEGDRLNAGAPLDPSFWDSACEFFAGFADRCHHNKEEAILFPALGNAGLPLEDGPVACLLDEHEDGRRLNRAMREATVSANRAALQDSARRFSRLLRQHIDKENQVLFQMARRMIKAEAEQQLRAGFEEARAADRLSGATETYLALARALCAKAGTPAPAALD